MLYQDDFKLKFLDSINSNDKWQERVITIPLELYKYINRCRSNKTLLYYIVKNTPDQGIYTGNRIGHHKRYTIDYIRPISENNIAWAIARIISGVDINIALSYIWLTKTYNSYEIVNSHEISKNRINNNIKFYFYSAIVTINVTLCCYLISKITI